MSTENEPRPASTRGAIDLSALSTPEAAQSAGEGGATWTKRITQADFQAVVEQSATAPILVSLGAASAAPSVELDALVGRVVDSYGGRFGLVLVDAQQEAAIAQAFRVQQIPAVVALVKGQPVPLFQGTAAEEQIRSLLDELLQLAAQHDVTGTLPPFGGQVEEPELPPLHQEALDAITAGDYAAAATAYRKALAEKPNDHDAEAGLANVELLGRVQDKELSEIRSAAAAAPDDLQAQLDVADVDVAGGHVDDAFNRLVVFIGRNAGDEREAARTRLVDLFKIIGTQDERVVSARQKLARVLF
ncbi:tetratricopeptide repeat protein [Zhihengliuella halotolerans]|uniref:Putative thioredoxin n=1 Tax=Zhihengliuella halotolerans TaxID=370736 RepID=A0A4V2G9T8_9MICC|nr:tetratricopeptide repeat protein [Zhihengliuella halotolerans]RZU61656.1 putative thioredoxin [Zhihengliuella halotolerans]